MTWTFEKAFCTVMLLYTFNLCIWASKQFLNSLNSKIWNWGSIAHTKSKNNYFFQTSFHALFLKISTNNAVMKHKKISAQNTSKIKRDLNQTRNKSKYLSHFATQKQELINRLYLLALVVASLYLIERLKLQLQHYC